MFKTKKRATTEKKNTIFEIYFCNFLVWIKGNQN